jgi:hypothetical protein
MHIGRVAVIGDLAGHLGELRRELVRLGAHPETLRLPVDLTVIQVGDLIHRGPDSEGVVIADEAIAALRSWWSAGRMRIAAVVSSPDEELLVTHAGLTEGFWRQALDSPPQASHAAAAINSFIGTHDRVLFSAGEMLGGGKPNLSAGPVWAGAASELIPSWLDSDQGMPFSQVHGHSMVVDWHRRQLRGDFGDRLRIDEDAAHETIALPGGRIIGIDPGHGRRPHRSWRALEIADATVR